MYTETSCRCCDTTTSRRSRTSYFKMLLLAIMLQPAMLLRTSSIFAQTNNSPASESHETKTIQVNGIKLHYIERGKGIPVVFVHGTVSDYRTWQGQTDAFSKNYRVISYSRRNHYPNEWLGDSSDFSVLQHAEDLAAFIETLQLGKVHLVGHSLGALVALITAYHHPELVRSLTLGEPPVMSLLRTNPEGDSLFNQFITNTIQPGAQALRSENSEKGVETFINGVMGRTDYFEKLSPGIRTIMMDNAKELKGELTSSNVFPSFSCEDALKIKVPVLLILAGQSPKLFHYINSQLEHCLPNVEQGDIPNVTHGLEFENPDAFNRIVLQFIVRH
jgi:non-heme chloroperoxidase